MQKSEGIGTWVERDVIALQHGTEDLDQGTRIEIDNRVFWVVEVLCPIKVRVIPEMDLKFSASSPDKFPIWRLMLLILMIYFIWRVLL